MNIKSRAESLEDLAGGSESKGLGSAARWVDPELRESEDPVKGSKQVGLVWVSGCTNSSSCIVTRLFFTCGSSWSSSPGALGRLVSGFRQPGIDGELKSDPWACGCSVVGWLLYQAIHAFTLSLATSTLALSIGSLAISASNRCLHDSL